MKKVPLIMFFSFLLVNLSFAQAVKLPTNNMGEVEFKEAVKVDGATTAQLWERAHQFFKDTYTNPKEIIDVDDKDAGKITGFGAFQTDNNYLVTYSIEINISNGSFDYNFTPFNYVNTNASNDGAKKQPFPSEQPRALNAKQWEVFTMSTLTTLTQICSQLKSTMAK
jgi:hypothetical protein